MLKNQLALLWLENEEHFQMQSIVRKTTKTKYMGIYNLDKISTLFKSMPCIKANLSVLHQEEVENNEDVIQLQN